MSTIVVVFGILLLAWAIFSVSGSFFFAVEEFGLLGVFYWIIVICTGIGAFCAFVFGFIYWFDKVDKMSKKAK